MVHIEMPRVREENPTQAALIFSLTFQIISRHIMITAWLGNEK